MCLQRKKIYTNAHRIFANGRYTPYELSIPCMECDECLQDRQNEYRVRTYYEYLATIRSGGYCIFDGLSYRDEELPHLNRIFKHVPDKLDFTCVNRGDIQRFLKRLRSNLKSRGWDPAGKLKYIIAAEYGQDDSDIPNYKTYRPHYHMMIFTTLAIPPIELSMIIKESWGKGRTNGVEDKGEKYFWEKGLVKTKAAALEVSNYIGKYCLKNSDYDKVAAYKVKELCKFFYKIENTPSEKSNLDNIFKKPEWRKKKNDILRQVKTFHLQSHGYGIYAIQNEGSIHDSMIGMPDKNRIYWWQKLPLYYVRKLYYDYKRINGKIIWYLNNIGLEWKKKNIEKVIEGYAKKLEEKENYVQSESFRQTIIEYAKSQNKIFDDSNWYRLNDLLYTYRKERKWKAYAEYIIYHKGRFWDGNVLKPSIITSLTARQSLYANTIADADELYYNYCHRTDIDGLGRQVISLRDLGDKDRGYEKLKGDELKPETFKNRYCIDENSSQEWNDFDKLKDVIDRIDYYINWERMNKRNSRKPREEFKANYGYKLTYKHYSSN